MSDSLLGPAEVRHLAAEIGLKPSKRWGQNFVVDANTVRRIVNLAGVTPGDTVLEVGPGFGSLTLGLLAAGAVVTAVEIDPALAGLLPITVARHLPESAGRLRVLIGDALSLPISEMGAPRHLIANLPYNVAVPVILHLLEGCGSIEQGLVMVQLEVAQRLTAGPGSRVYGVPSAKLAWFAGAQLAGTVPASVFWPMPNVASGLVRFQRRAAPVSAASRDQVFAVVDSAFAQRRKMLRSALSGLATPEQLEAAGVDPSARGETLSIGQFAAIAESLAAD